MLRGYVRGPARDLRLPQPPLAARVLRAAPARRGLADGRELLLLDNRGFASLLGFAAESQEELDRMLRGAESIKDALSLDTRAGAAISVEEVGRLPHDVLLDDALLEATEAP